MDNFLERVEGLMQAKSSNELKVFVMKMAAKTPVESMDMFLTLLKNEKVIISGHNESDLDVNGIMNRIKELHESVEDYEIEVHFYESYGWHDYEGMEGWDIEDDSGFSEEFYSCYNGAVSILEHGFYNDAACAFTFLEQIIEKFDAWNENNNEGALYFETLIEEGWIEIDTQKLCVLKGYSLLMAQPKDINSIWGEIFDSLRQYKGNLMLKDILQAGTEPVPDLDAVINSWVSFLFAQPTNIASVYVKEAALLSGRTELLENYVDVHGSKEPKAYIHLCELYIENGVDAGAKVIAKALEGLKKTSVKAENRAGLAGLLANAAMETGNAGVYRYAITEKFNAEPTFENFIAIFELGEPETIKVAIINMDESLKAIGSKKASSMCDDYYLIHFLNGDYDLVFDVIKSDKKQLGWSYSLKGLLAPFFIGLLAEFDENAVMIKKIIKDKMEYSFHDINSDSVYKMLRESLGEIAPEQVKNWSERLIREAGSRTDAIVSEKHRGSYYKAAELLVAVSEMQFHRKEAEPYGIIYKYTAKYPRHSAFRAEVRAALADSGLSGIKV